MVGLRKRRTWALAILVGAVVGGCHSAPAASPAPPVAAKASWPPQYPVKPNEFVIYRVFGRIPMVLDRDYGVMLINDGDERKPRARFILAIRRGRKLVDTHSFTKFRRALRRIPRGAAVYPYDTCTVLRSYGLPESDFRRFDRAMRRFRRLKPEEGRGICICEG